MNAHTSILLWGPMIGALLADHLLLRFWYGKPTSLERIVRLEPGTRLDCVYWMIFYVVLPSAGTILLWTTLPGLVLLALIRLSTDYGLHGLLSEVMPASGIAAMVIWLFAEDALRYATHVLLHRVPALWSFHKVHHAATVFNIITGNRVSLAEKVLHDVGKFLLLGMVIGLPTPSVALTVLFIRNLLNVLQHSDLPWDYGWLGYLLVSPRFHRMHHSSHETDADTNFGTIFSCWDYVFGTVAPRYARCPADADSCALGLSSPRESDEINCHWIRSVFNGTLLDHALALLRLMRFRGRWPPLAGLPPDASTHAAAGINHSNQ